MAGPSGYTTAANSFTKTKTLNVTASATSAQPGWEALKAFDGNSTEAASASPRGRRPHRSPGELTLTLPFAQSISQIRIAEEESHVIAFYVEAFVNGAWTTVASGTSLGPNYAASFPAVSTYKLRVTVAGRGCTLAEVWAY